MRRTTLLMLALMAAGAGREQRSGLAKAYVGTDNGEKIVGTKFADRINAFGGDDVLLGYAGSDKLHGGDDKSSDLMGEEQAIQEIST